MANEIVTEFPVTEVTVYARSARVRREQKVAFRSGENRLVVRKLPEALDIESVRIDTGSSRLLRIRDIASEERYTGLPDENEYAKAKPVLEGLLREKRSVENGIRNRNEEFMLFADKGSILESLEDASGRPMNIGLWREYFEFLDRKLLENREAARGLIFRWFELNEKIAAAAANLKKFEGYNRVRERAVIVTADCREDAEVPLALHYLQSDASWHPAYTIRADIAAKRVAVTLHGMIRQAGGEDWINTALLLSTAIPMDNCELPELRSLRLKEQDAGMTMAVSSMTLSDADADTPEPAAEEECRLEAKADEAIVTDAFMAGVAMDEPKAKRRAAPSSRSRGMESAKGYAAAPPPNYAAASVAPAMPRPGMQAMPGGSSTIMETKQEFRKDKPMEADAVYANLSRSDEIRDYRLSLAGFPKAFSELGAFLSMKYEPSVPAAEADVRYNRVFLSGVSLERSCGGFDYRYRVLRESNTVPSNGQPVQVPVETRDLGLELVHIAVPMEKEQAYLKGRFTNKGNPLPAGPLQVFLGNDFVGNSTLPTLAENQAGDVSLGIDRDVKIVRRENSQQRTKGLIGKDTITDYSVTIEAANLKDEDIRIEIYDRLPVVAYGVKDTEILELRHKTPPDKASDDGILKWSKTIRKGEKLILEFSYSVRVKEDYRPVLTRSARPFAEL